MVSDWALRRFSPDKKLKLHFTDGCVLSFTLTLWEMLEIERYFKEKNEQKLHSLRPPTVAERKSQDMSRNHRENMENVSIY